jgi:phosphoribosylformylglycinamidine (FGAM) synthase-like enzyme
MIQAPNTQALDACPAVTVSIWAGEVSFSELFDVLAVSKIVNSAVIVGATMLK